MIKSQNIYDNQDFFDSYKKLRDDPYCCNNIEEKPALFSFVPNLRGKTVLDLGCGCGENCSEFLRRGALSVTGVDVSEKMLEVAKAENPEIEFVRGDMNDLSFLNKKYDAIFSSLAIHYVEDFNRFAKEVFALLQSGGSFVFSQEHPLNTCTMNDGEFTRDENGKALYFNMDSYMISGKRTISWLVDGVEKYHRTFSEIVNGLTSAGFIIEKMLEPLPDEHFKDLDPLYQSRMEKQLHRPIFLVVRAHKA